MFILAFIVLVIVVIFYYRAKNKYLEAHPEKIKKYRCSFCNQEFEKVIPLSDGAICDNCQKIGDEGWHTELFLLGHSWKSKNISVNDVRRAMADVENKRMMLANLSVTRSSESGRIHVDDNQKVFYVNHGAKPIVLHRISDISEFYLEYEYEDISPLSSESSYEVKSGNVVIRLNEVFDLEEVSAHVDSKMFTQRNEVKKVFEPDLVFLEEITGKKRKPIPNKIKIL
ncbi:MAG: hypothetical protein MJ123_06910 [Lachnospiraceae bacterium]|nr:hypothetical protein [Lachnospiraceae bacterium]